MAQEGPAPPTCEVIILTALPIEFQAVLAHLQETREIIHPQGTIYQVGSFARESDRLQVAVAQIGMGGGSAAVETERAIHFFRPHLLLFVGIAGGLKDVQLGDVVAATKVYAYESGKAGHTFEPRPEVWRASYPLEQRARHEASNQAWLVRLKSSIPDPVPRAYVGALAAGEKVLASTQSSVYRQIKATYGDALAIEMEGHGFLQAIRVNHDMYGLVIRGISDLVDNKAAADAGGSQSRAARHAAVFAFQVLATFAFSPSSPSSSSLTSHAVWSVPYPRNPYFTGRDDLLDQLTHQLTPAAQEQRTTTRRAALTQPQAITGLGGIGKTQVAVEYAYRSREQGRYTHTLWVNAANKESVLASFVEIAGLLPDFAARNETDQSKLIEAVKRWLEQCKQPWLLIFDNVDHDEDLPALREYLPQEGNGSVLLTTRVSAVGSLATAIEVETMGFVEGTQLLLRRAQRFEHTSDEEINRGGNIVAVLDHFPLALDQAGAYIEETRCSFEEYLNLYQTHRQKLLAERGEMATDYPDSVATTWSLSFQKVQQKNPAAAELLQLCSFLAPDRIPEELITDGAAFWPAFLQQDATDPFAFQQMMKELLKYSLVKRLVEDRALSIHRLVQAVQRDRMEPEMHRQWAERVVRAVNKIFPDPQNIANWPQCLRYLDQTQACYELIEDYGLTFVTAANILNQTGIYLDIRGLYALAEPLFKHALVINEQQLGEHPDTATSLDNLAVLYQKQGRYEEAEPLLARALAIREKQLEPDHPNMTQNLNNLAALYQAQGRYEKAEPLHLRALAICEQHMGPEHPKTTICLNNLATLYQAQGRYEEAEPLLVRALAIREKQLGPDHPNTAQSLHHLATLYQAQGRYEKAEPLYVRALAIREKQLEPEHPDIAQSLNNLAALYQVQGRYEEAEPLLARALAIREKQLGPEHPSIVQVLHHLAAFYQAQGLYEKAEPLHRRALAIREKQLGPEHPQTAQSLHNLGALYYMQGRYGEAEPLLARALAISQQKLGLGHPQTQQMIQMQQIVSYYLTLLSKIDRSEDLESLVQLLAQEELDKDKDKGRATEEEAP